MARSCQSDAPTCSNPFELAGSFRPGSAVLATVPLRDWSPVRPELPAVRAPLSRNFSERMTQSYTDHRPYHVMKPPAPRSATSPNNHTCAIIFVAIAVARCIMLVDTVPYHDTHIADPAESELSHGKCHITGRKRRHPQ
jgi:hypothetical protein